MSGARTWARRFTATALAALALAVPAPPAAAQIVRAFTPRFSVNQPGDIRIVGNTVMSCNGGGNCNNSRNGTGNAINNNDNTMQYVDNDGVSSTFSSTNATFTLPAGATVTWAGLYWGGYTTNALRSTVKFGVPGGGTTYSTLNASRLDASGSAYQAFAEVTTQVRAAGSGVYRVADVYSTAGTSNVHAGWALVVVYADATQPARNLVVFDGYALVSGTTTVNMTVNGFVTPPAGAVNTRLGVVALEGDLGYTGDSFRLNGTAIGDALNPTDNFFNSSITSLGAQFTAKTPNYVNQLGFDADLVSANGILANGATSAAIALTTNGDTYYPGAVTFATDLYAPVFDAANFTKTVTDVNGGAVRPGDVLEYAVSMRNNGLDHAIACVMRDTLPANATYVPGSLRVTAGPNTGAKTDDAGDDVMEYDAASRAVIARLGTGATAAAGGRIDVATTTTVTFRVTVNAPQASGTAVSNQAALAFTGQQSGVAFAARSDGSAAAGGTQPTVVTVSAAKISGTVFEDVQYGGGAGRSLAASAGVGRPGARVELYDASGAFLQVARTDAAGAYAFDGWPAGDYRVRVVGASVRSSRTGAVAGLLPVPTFRTDAASGTPVAVTDRVGGDNPAVADADSNTTSAAYATLTTAAATPQSATDVALGTADVGGVDFGFNFDTITNARDAGAGSLRQFLLNANALGNSGLAQAGLPAGTETSVFMVSDGGAHPGLRAGLANQLANGVVRIVLASPLPVLTDALTRVDGGTQTTNVGDTNPGTLGAAPTAGTDDVAVGAVAAPEVELRDGAALALGLDVTAANTTVRAIALNGFGNAAGSANDAAIRVGAIANAFLLEDAVLGTYARAFADSGAATRCGGDLLRAVGGDAGVVRRTLFGFVAGSAVTLAGGSDSWTIANVEVRGVAIGNGARGAVSVEASSGLALSAAWIGECEGNGVDARTSGSAVSLVNVTVRRCGLGAAGTTATAGVRAGGGTGRVERCELALNVGAGVQVTSGASNWTITRNSIWGNGTASSNGGGAASGQLGVDLQAAADDVARGTAPYVTRNDNGDGDAGGNALLNYPVLDYAVLANGSFTVSGWARPGSTIELFAADPDGSGFGEGRTFVVSVVEGSAADLDATSSTYSGTINGLAQGTDNTRRFRFTMAAPPGVAPGVTLTATATIAGTGTSEFSGGAPVTTGVSLAGVAYADTDHDAQRDAGEAGTGLSLWAKLFAAGSAAASQVVAVDGTSGAFAFTFVSAGTYVVKLDTSADGADSTADAPAGWVRTESPTGTRGPLAVAATDVNGQAFGLWHGSVVRGVVFRDDGGGLAAGANDGARGGGEALLDGERVRLSAAACAGGACDSALTDGGGAFALWLPYTLAGSTVRVGAPPAGGWLATGGRAGDTGGTYDRAASGVAFTAAAGLEYSGLQFGEVPRNAWVANEARTVASGTATAYAHRFTAASSGQVRFAASGVATPALPGWTVTLYRDLDCDGVVDVGEPVLAPADAVTLAAGQGVCVIARHASPAGAPAGAREQQTLTASFTYANAAPALSSSETLQDVTTIALASGLVLTKSVDLANARPGDALVYTITFENPGDRPLSNIVIRDATPAWTVFESAACAGAADGITGCALTQPAVGANGAVTWTLAGALAPGGRGSVSYRVRVQ